jgi:hypothetical protein
MPLKFPLAVEDEWPPVSVECLPFAVSEEHFEALVPPLFVSDMSVGDIIAATLDEEEFVESWSHVHRSGRTTIWLLRLGQTDEIAEALARLRELECNTVSLDSAGCYAVDIPESLTMSAVDEILNSLNGEMVAVAFPSMRHSE